VIKYPKLLIRITGMFGMSDKQNASWLCKKKGRTRKAKRVGKQNKILNYEHK
jgi:hypothetical protein